MPRLLAAFALAVAVAASLACGGGNDTPSASGVGGGSIATATTSPGRIKPTEAPTLRPDEVSVANEPFSVETADGTVLRGRIYSPDGPKRQALIIAAPVEQSVWAESTRTFTSEGVAVFTFDPRGFGETGGEEDAEALAEDIQLVLLFAKSREYPLLYVLAAGPEAGEAAAAKAARREELSGLVTYGFEGPGGAANHLSLAPGAPWDGEDVLADPGVADEVLAFVLGE